MVLLESCAFTHLPRTGGTFLHAMVEDKILQFNDHEFHSSLTLELRMHGMPLYGFVRDPVTWYESWYSLFLNGSEVYPAANQDPTILSIGTDKTIDEIVYNLCNPTAELKHNAYKMAIVSYGGRLSFNMLELLRRWQDNDLSFYENMCEAYLTDCTEVGRFEALPSDLVRMLRSCGQLTDAEEQRILAARPINFAERTGRTKLSPDTITMIKEVEAPMRLKYGYMK